MAKFFTATLASVAGAVAIAALIDLVHVGYMATHCAPPCPTPMFPTPLFLLALATVLPGLLILTLIAKGRGTRDSWDNVPNSVPKDSVKLDILSLLPSVERDIIKYLIKSGGQATQASIAKDLGLGKVRAWRAIRRLESKGLVEVVKVKGRNLVRLRDRDLFNAH